MSKPREDWWASVRSAIRAYPGRKRRLSELRRTSLTPNYGASIGGSGPSDPVYAAVTRTLPPQQQRELDAVESALEETRQMPDGVLRIRLIELYHFRKTHKLIGAGLEVGYAEKKAKEINGDFIRLVGKNLGYSENGYN